MIATSRRRPAAWALLFCALAGAGCAGVFASGGSGVVKGTVAVAGGAPLPADAVIEVKLSDVTEPGEAAKPVGDVKIGAEGRPTPISFELRYDTGKILDTHIYVLRAAIRSGGKMLFATDTAYPVLTQGKPATADLMLVRVAE